MKKLFTYFSNFAPDNKSGMHRLWTDNGPIKSRKLFAVLALLLFVSIGNVWGAPTTVTKTMTQIVTANGYTVSAGQSVTCYTSFALDANITVSTTGTANCGSFWGSPNQEWRLYQNKSGNVTVTAASGYQLESVTYTYGTGNSGILNTSGCGSSIASSYRKASESPISISGSSYTLYVGNTGTGTSGQVKITQISVTYSAAAPSCAKTVTLANGSPTNGTISFSPAGPVETCDAAANVTMTITPSAGYQLTGWTSSGVSPSNISPAIATSGASSKAAQAITLTFAQNANGTYTAGATFTAMTDHFIDALHSTTGYTGVGMAKSGDYSASLPTISDKSSATSGTCQQLHYHFAGWVTETYKDSPSGHIVTLDGHASGTTYYAVWEKQSDDDGTVTDVINHALVVAANSNIKTNNNSTWATATIDGSSSGAQYYVRSMGLNNATNYAMRWNSNGYLYCKTAPTTGYTLKSITVTTTSNKAVALYAATSKYSSAATSTSLGSNLTATSSGATYALTAAQLANNYTCVGINGTESGTEIVSISITYDGAVSYEDPVTSCCTELGSINGSFKWSKDLEDIESPNSFNIYLVYFSMSKIFLSLISVPDSSTIFECVSNCISLFINVCTPTHAKNGNSVYSGITVL